MTLPVFDRRRAGVLLHLGSLDAALGRGGRAFIDWLAQAGFSLWQILPVGPTGFDGSPYWVRSDSAGNATLIDPDEPAPLKASEFQAFLQAFDIPHFFQRLWRNVRIDGGFEHVFTDAGDGFADPRASTGD